MGETVKRKSFQGVFNIIRFNWHFYLIAFMLFAATFFLPPLHYFPSIYIILRGLILFPLLISLLVSFYIYDCSGFYSFAWLRKTDLKFPASIVNINAGFDETSAIIRSQFKNSNLTVLDFYNPEKHTEVSIKRARKAYPAYAGTKAIDPQNVPLDNDATDCIFLVFAAHEIRSQNERVIFFRELKRILNHDGAIILVEHLRDFPNFLAFNIGFFHFYSEKNWKFVIETAGLKIHSAQKLSPYTSAFILKKNGTTS